MKDGFALSHSRTATELRPHAISLSSHRVDIDGLRAVAAITIVFFHYGVPGFSGGFVGVDILL